MSRTLFFSRMGFTVVGALMFASYAQAAGFEKAQTWSAKAAAQAGAVVGSTAGAEALFFNPAGLVESSTRGEVSVNFSPTFSKFTGTNPFSQAGSVSGSSGFSPIAGIVASFKPTPKLGLGIGYFVSGGSKSKFENLDYAGSAPLSANFAALAPTVETSIAITEASLGAGYQVMPGFRLGFAWRIVNVDAKFSTINLVNNAALSEITVDNIKAKRWNAFKIGAQYEEPMHRWGLGLNFRSAVEFTGKGDTSVRFKTASPVSTVTTGTPGSAELDNTFPLQISFGGWTRATELLRIGYEYSYTNYAENRELAIRGNVNGAALSSIAQHWKNMHVVRLGGEYKGMGLPLRFGYAYTSQVTPNDYARSTFSSPGPGHSFTAGTGMIIANNIDLDGALEYAFAGGTGTNPSTNSGGTAEVPTAGDFKSSAYAAHISAKYHF